MKKEPKISIIINCYNGAKYLAKTLISVKNQTYKNFEVIFWDNGSTDDSKKILERYKDKRFKYFFDKNKKNLYHSRYLAFKKTTGKYIAFIDTDDFWLKEKLLEQVTLAEKNNANFVYSNYFFFNQISNSKSILYKGLLPEGYILNKLFKNYSIGLLTIFFKKKFLIENKIYFQKDYHVIGDLDITMRILRKTKAYCVQKPLAVYRWHPENISSNQEKLRILEMQRWIVLNKKKFQNYKYFNNLKLNINYSILKNSIKEKNYNNFIYYFFNVSLLQKLKFFFWLLVPNFIIRNVVIKY